jgi:hypothetical protein
MGILELRYAVGIVLVLVCLCDSAVAQLLLGVTGARSGGAPVPPMESLLLLVDGTSHLLLADGSSKLCLVGGC